MSPSRLIAELVDQNGMKLPIGGQEESLRFGLFWGFVLLFLIWFVWLVRGEVGKKSILLVEHIKLQDGSFISFPKRTSTRKSSRGPFHPKQLVETQGDQGEARWRIAGCGRVHVEVR